MTLRKSLLSWVCSHSMNVRLMWLTHFLLLVLQNLRWTEYPKNLLLEICISESAYGVQAYVHTAIPRWQQELMFQEAEAQDWITKDQQLSPAGKTLSLMAFHVPVALDQTHSSLALFFFFFRRLIFLIEMIMMLFLLWSISLLSSVDLLCPMMFWQPLLTIEVPNYCTVVRIKCGSAEGCPRKEANPVYSLLTTCLSCLC